MLLQSQPGLFSWVEWIMLEVRLHLPSPVSQPAKLEDEADVQQGTESGHGEYILGLQHFSLPGSVPWLPLCMVSRDLLSSLTPAACAWTTRVTHNSLDVSPTPLLTPHSSGNPGIQRRTWESEMFSLPPPGGGSGGGKRDKVEKIWVIYLHFHAFIWIHFSLTAHGFLLPFQQDHHRLTSVLWGAIIEKIKTKSHCLNDLQVII